MGDQSFKKAQSCKKAHFYNRLLERFGVRLLREEYEEMVRQIEDYDNKPIFIEEEDGKSFHLFNIHGNSCVVLYDWDYKCILTVYYKKWFKQLPNGRWVKQTRFTKSKYLRIAQRSRDYNNKMGNLLFD